MLHHPCFCTRAVLSASSSLHKLLEYITAAMNPEYLEEEKYSFLRHTVQVSLGDSKATEVVIDQLRQVPGFDMYFKRMDEDMEELCLPALPGYYNIVATSQHVKLLLGVLERHSFGGGRYKLCDIEAVFCVCDYFGHNYLRQLEDYFQRWMEVTPCFTLLERLHWQKSIIPMISDHFTKLNKVFADQVEAFYDNFNGFTSGKVVQLLKYKIGDVTKGMIIEELFRVDAVVLAQNHAVYSLNGGTSAYVGGGDDHSSDLKLGLCALDGGIDGMDHYWRCRRILGIWMGVDGVKFLSPDFIKHLVAVNNIFLQGESFENIIVPNDLCILIASLWEDIEKSLLTDGIDDKHRGVYGWNLKSFFTGRLWLLIKARDCRHALEDGGHFNAVMDVLDQFDRRKIADVVFKHTNGYFDKVLKFYSNEEIPGMVLDNVATHEESVAGFCDGYVRCLNYWFKYVVKCVLVCDAYFITNKDRVSSWLVPVLHANKQMDDASKQWDIIAEKAQQLAITLENENVSEYGDGDNIPDETDSEDLAYNARKYLVIFEKCKSVFKVDIDACKLVKKWRSLPTQCAFSIGLCILHAAAQGVDDKSWKCENVYLKFAGDVVGVDWSDR